MRLKRGWRRRALTVVAFSFSMVMLLVLAGGVLMMGLGNGSIDIDIARQISAALNSHVGGGYTFTVGSTAIQGTATGPSLAIRSLAVKDGRNRTIIAAPRASVSVDPLRLIVGQISPKRLELDDLTVKLIRLPNGVIALSAGADEESDVPLTELPSTLATPASPGPAGRDGPSAPAGEPSAAAPATPAPPQIPAAIARAVTAASDALFSDDSPLRAVDRLGLAHATLQVDDRLRRTTTLYRNVTLDLDREATGGIYVTMSGDGPAGHWSGAARATRLPDGSRKIEVAADKLSPDELLLAAGLRAAKFETDMPLSFSLTAEVGPDGALRRAGGPISFGEGYFKLDDPDHEPAMVDSIQATLSVNPATGQFDLGKGMLVAGPTRFLFDLWAVPPAQADAPWTIAGKSTGTFGPERPGEQPIALDRIAFSSRYVAATHQLFVDTASAGGPETDFTMSATFAPTDTGFLVTSKMTMGRMPGPNVIRLWPNWVAAPVRAWLLRNLKGGMFEYGRGQVSLTDVDLETMRNQHSVAPDHVHIEFGVSNGSLAFMDGVPPLRGLDGTGVLTGNSFAFTASKADMEVSPGHRLMASEGSLVVPDTDPKPTPATIGMRVTGSIESLADLLSREALKSFANLPIDSSSIAGSFDGRLTVGMKMGSHNPKDDTKIGIVATAKDFSASKVIGKEGLQDATLNVTADATGLRAKGEGRMFGAPAQIDIKKPSGGGPSEASLSLTLDDAARQKAGLGFGRSVTGPITAKITTSLTSAEKSRANVTVDFTRCAFDAPIPGLRKLADRPSKATFAVVQEPTRTQLDQIVFDSGATSIHGSAVLDGNGGFVSASLSQMRLSPGDDAKVDIAKSGDGMKVSVRATNIDARPYLKYVTGADGDAKDQSAKPIDLDLKANLVTGQNGQAMSGVDLKLAKSGNLLRRVQLSGRAGKGTLSAKTVGTGANVALVVSASDAGALLSFLDLYKRMDGGQLDTTLKFGEKQIDGTAIIHNFTIREDPSLKKLAEQQIPANSNTSGRIDPSAVSFTKLEALFTRVGNRVEVRQGAMFGPQLGATVEGAIDFGHDKVALSGTLVPLYGLNNLFSQVPLLGPLLGGGAHEGLFALNYRIVGSATAPVFTVNPLSALAPGFLRKIFGALDNAAQQGLEGTSREAGAPTPGGNPAPDLFQ